jgi:dihydrofolate reductase
MRNIVFSLGVSLDGFMEGPGHDISWHRMDDELHRHMNEWLAEAGGFLEGRITWEGMAEVWPTADQRADLTELMKEFGPIWTEMPKIVYSRTLERADWNTTIAREVVPDEVRALKEQPGGDLVVGGPDLAATFRAHDLIDEYRVYVNPVLLGAGTPMFRPSDRQDLRLVETRTFGVGVVLLRYERDRGSGMPVA